MRLAWLLLSLLLLLASSSRCPSEELKIRFVMKPHTGGTSCLAFSPDGKVLATGGQHIDHQTKRTTSELKLWDVETGKLRETRKGHTGRIESLAFSRNGKTLATASSDFTIKLWELKSSKQSSSFRITDYGIESLTFSPNDKTLGYAGAENVKLLDVATGKEIASFARPRQGYAMVFSPDLRTLAAPNHQDANLYDTSTGKESRVFEDHRGSVWRIAFSADGRGLAVASTRQERERFFGEITLWDLATGRRRAVFKGGTNCIRALAFSPDGKLLAVAGSKELLGPNEVKLIDAASGRELVVVAIPNREAVGYFAFSSDGRLLAGSTGYTLTVWDVQPAPVRHK